MMAAHWEIPTCGRNRYAPEPGRHHAPNRPPLRTLEEIAEELGVTRNKLHGLIVRNRDTAPKPFIPPGSTSQRRYYNPALMRAWYENLEKK